jgi:hypothetical protein
MNLSLSFDMMVKQCIGNWLRVGIFDLGRNFVERRHLSDRVKPWLESFARRRATDNPRRERTRRAGRMLVTLKSAERKDRK